MLKLATLQFNPFAENTYVIYDNTKECVIIDAGCYSPKECSALEAFIEKNELRPVMALNTHGHIDHICGVDFVTRRWEIPFAIHSFDSSILEMAPCHGAAMGFNIENIPTIDIDLLDQKEIRFGESKIQIIHTPGHTPGHIVVHCPDEKIVISGDLLFKESIGRTDLPGGDYSQLMDSIINKIIPLGTDIKVFPGHGSSTTTAHELMFNPFIVEAIQGEVNYKSNEN